MSIEIKLFETAVLSNSWHQQLGHDAVHGTIEYLKHCKFTSDAVGFEEDRMRINKLTD